MNYYKIKVHIRIVLIDKSYFGNTQKSKIHLGYPLNFNQGNELYIIPFVFFSPLSGHPLLLDYLCYYYTCVTIILLYFIPLLLSI